MKQPILNGKPIGRWKKMDLFNIIMAQLNYINLLKKEVEELKK